MNTVSDQFWPTVATVIPVLALAMIVEIRSIIARWDADLPWWIRSTQGLVWFLALIQIAIVETVAFNYLASGETSSAWVLVAKESISASIVTLIIAPALSILGESNIHIYATALTRLARAPGDWQYFMLSRGAKRNLRLLAEKKKGLDELMARAINTERLILSSEHPDSSECQEDLAKVQGYKRRISSEIESAEAIRKEVIENSDNIRNEKERLTARRKELITQLEKDLTKADDRSDASRPKSDGSPERASKPLEPK
jgi:hypothetical protein